MGFLWWRFLCLQTSTLMQRKSFILVLVYLCITELLVCSRSLKRLKLLFLNQGIIPFFFSPIKFKENVRLKEIWDKGTSRKIKSNRKKRDAITWSAARQISWNKEHFYILLCSIRIFRYITWSLFHCFGKPIWPPWRHVKTSYGTNSKYKNTVY